MDDHRESDARARIASVLPGSFELSRLDTRWLALGSELVAFAADDDAEWRRLEQERWLVERWRAAGVPASRVVSEHVSQRVQVRERVRGLYGPQIHTEEGHSPLFETAVPDARQRLESAPLSAFGARVAESYGELAARIRRAISVADASAVGLGVTSRRTLDLDGVLARLDATHASRSAKAAARRARPWLEQLPAANAVIHSDLHFFNMCVAEDGTIAGLFDFGDSGIDTAETELLYIHSIGAQFVSRVVEAYGEVNLDAVRHAHVRVALGHLIWHPPGTERHESIVAWITAALERLA